jgi:hypothetical protein
LYLGFALGILPLSFPGLEYTVDYYIRCFPFPPYCVRKTPPTIVKYLFAPHLSVIGSAVAATARVAAAPGICEKETSMSEMPGIGATRLSLRPELACPAAQKAEFPGCREVA